MTEANGKASSTPSIQVRGVTKRFGDNIAVNNVSFEVRRGQVVGFLGPNGSGKTTTLRLLTSFYTPDSGTILIDGTDNQENDVETRRKIGYLPENNPNYGDLLTVEYLNFVGELRGLAQPERQANIDQAVYETGIEAVYYKPINQCSKGYKQRIGLAAVILHQPAILIMDEPTEGLDPNQRVPIRDLIRRIGSERTVLLSTHVLQEAEVTCDRILMISRGRIVAEGDVDVLKNQARGESSIYVEIEGERVVEALKRLKNVTAVRRLDPVNRRKRYSLAVSEKADVRPAVFELAKKSGWVLWDLHEETGRLEDLFHSLTMESVSLRDELK